MDDTVSAKVQKEPCRSIYLHAFRGDRNPEFRRSFAEKLEAEKEGKGLGPTLEECLLYAGHVGISFDDDSTIYGFTPVVGEMPVWEILDELKKGKAFTAVVSNDSSVFEAARRSGLAIHTIEYVYPESRFQEIREVFLKEQGAIASTYSFPGGQGDCNCATWPARLGLPLPEETGIMQFYVEAMSQMDSPQQMGECEG